MHFKYFVAASPVCYLLSLSTFDTIDQLEHCDISIKASILLYFIIRCTTGLRICDWSADLEEILLLTTCRNNPSHCVQAKSWCCAAGPVHKLYRVVKIARTGNGSFSNNIDSCAVVWKGECVQSESRGQLWSHLMPSTQHHKNLHALVYSIVDKDTDM